MNRRSRPLAAVTAAASLLAAGVLASTGPAAAAPDTAAAHVAAAPLGTHWRVTDPAAYARAIRSGNWAYTPEGLAPKSCVHHVPAGGRVAADGDIVTKSGAVHHVTRCTTPTLAYPGPQGSWVKPADTPGPGSACNGLSGGWWAATCGTDSNPHGLVYLNENFSIPSPPAQAGALIFYFPAFQSADATSIVQPVLSWGANATTGVTNGNIWYMTDWVILSGTSYISDSVHIGSPGTVNGLMQLVECGLGYTDCRWQLTMTAGSASAKLDVLGGVPTMTQIFGGVMEVPRAHGCVETPPNGHEAFRNLVVKDWDRTITPSFAKLKNPSPQCSVSPAASSGINTDITWTS